MNIAIVASLSQLDKIVVESSIASLVDMLKPLSCRLLIIAANSPSYSDAKMSTVKLVKYGDKQTEFILAKLSHHFRTDLRLALILFRLRRQIDFVIYYVVANLNNISGILMLVLLLAAVLKFLSIFIFIWAVIPTVAFVAVSIQLLRRVKPENE